MKNTRYLLLSLIIVILGLIYLKYVYAPRQTSELVTATPTPTASPAPSAEPWPTLTTPSFRLSYPPEASASARDGGPDSQSWAVLFVGPSQRESGRTQTELFDGYAVTLDVFTIVGDNAAYNQALADRGDIVAGCGETSVSDILPLELAGLSGFRFIGGCLGQATHSYLATSTELFRLTAMVASDKTDNLAKYQDVVEAITNSVVLINPSPQASPGAAPESGL